MLISLIVVAYNEEQELPDFFDCLLAQDYPLKQVELLLVDSASTDKTRSCFKSFIEEHGWRFDTVHMLENPKRILPAGINVALKKLQGDAVVRLDAHAEFPPNFLSQSVSILAEGHDVVGGQRPCIDSVKTAWSGILWLLEESLFGASIAAYRRAPQAGPVTSLFHGLYRREVYERVGLYDERLHRIEDNDMSYRIRKAGYELWFDPSIISYQKIRPNFKAMLRQKYGNGFWIGRGLREQPACISWYHLVPFVFLCALLLGLVVGCIFSCWWLLALVLIPYVLLTLCMTILSLPRMPIATCYACLMPLLFFMLHISYGWGTARGLVLSLIKPLEPKHTEL